MGLSLLDVGVKVRELRKKMDMNANMLAEAADLSPQSVSDIEGGKRLFQVDTLTKLCDALAETPNVLLGYEEYSPLEHIARQLVGLDEEELELVQVMLTQIKKTYHNRNSTSIQ